MRWIRTELFPLVLASFALYASRIHYAFAFFSSLWPNIHVVRCPAPAINMLTLPAP